MQSLEGDIGGRIRPPERTAARNAKKIIKEELEKCQLLSDDDASDSDYRPSLSNPSSSSSSLSYEGESNSDSEGESRRDGMDVDVWPDSCPVAEIEGSVPEKQWTASCILSQGRMRDSTENGMNLMQD